MRYEESFGVVPLSKERGRWEVFLIQHNRSGYWGFPKGHAENKETAEEAAFRELKEETNLDFVAYVQAEPFVEQYQFLMEGKRISKRVSYFAAIVSGKVKLQEKEIQNGAWVSLSDAYSKLTHAEGKAILAHIEKILPPL